MIVTSHPVELVLPASLTPRSEGVHLSGILRSAAILSKVLDIDEDWSVIDDKRELPAEAIPRICMGLAWEEWYIRTQLPEVVDHPGEMEMDGVFMTPDGEELTRFIYASKPQWFSVVHEVKLTYKSLNTVCGSGKKWGTHWSQWDTEIYDSAVNPIGPMSSQWLWLAQVKAYCLAKQTRFAVLHVLFVAGDYSYPLRPRAYQYCIEFTDQELEDNWNLLIDHRDYVMGRVA